MDCGTHQRPALTLILFRDPDERTSPGFFLCRKAKRSGEPISTTPL
jgi:hypothetical protein